MLLAPLIAELMADEISEPGSLAVHPYRVTRPMLVPQLHEVLTPEAAESLADHLLGSHTADASRPVRRQLAAVLTQLLPTAVAASGEGLAAAMARLFAYARLLIRALVHRYRVGAP